MKKNTILSSIKAYFEGGWIHFINTCINGIFTVAPFLAIGTIIYWLYGKADILVGHLFNIIGLTPKNYPIIWTIAGVVLLIFVSYVIGHFVQTRIGNWVRNFLELISSKIPGFLLLKKLISLFNSSKSGEKDVLVVMISGSFRNSYRIGLMYSVEESITRGCYSVSISQSPLPNGGFIHEEPADKIWVLEGVTFNHYMEYLLSMQR